MNKINPLYLFLFFAFVALFMAYQSSQTELKTAYAAQKNSQLERTGKQIMSLKDQWNNPQKAQKRIDSIISQRAFAKKITKKEHKKGKYRIEFKGLGAAQLDNLTTKLLNESLIINSLKIVRNNKKELIVVMEFAL